MRSTTELLRGSVSKSAIAYGPLGDTGFLMTGKEMKKAITRDINRMLRAGNDSKREEVKILARQLLIS